MIGRPPVRFRRPAGMLPLPSPGRAGRIEALRSHAQPADRNDFVLAGGLAVWRALRPVGPYPLLAVSGEQGSAKTVLSKLLRALIDPNAAPVRALSREQRELIDCRQQRPPAGLRQSLRAARLALRRALPARQRRQFRGAAALYGRRGGAV